MVLLISFDLNGRERPAAYQAVRQAIELHALATTRPLFSQWLIETNEPLITWRERLRQVIDDDDRLLICAISRHSYEGWLPESYLEWIRLRT